MGSWLNCNSCSILLTIPLAANLARSTAGELTLELTALLALRARVVLAGERLRLRVLGVVVTASAPAPHPATSRSRAEACWMGLDWLKGPRQTLSYTGPVAG